MDFKWLWCEEDCCCFAPRSTRGRAAKGARNLINLPGHFLQMAPLRLETFFNLLPSAVKAAGTRAFASFGAKFS